MTMKEKRLCCYLWISLSLQVLCYAASFYGTSFIHLPLEDVSSENEITLRFRTSRTRGLLFLAAGQHDYCIIQIESGRIHVLMQGGSGEIHMTLDQKIKVNDLVWHQVSLQQLEGSVTLSVDQKFSKTMDLPGKQYVLDVTDGIYVGSTSIDFDHTYASKVEKSFRGCIENVMFNNIDVFQLSLETDHATSNDITPNCSAQFVAAPNDPISFVSDTAYLQMPRWAILTRGSFACWLKTSVGNGLILYQGGHTKDFIAVELSDGKVRTVFDRGSGIVDFVSSIRIDDVHWHYLIVAFTDMSISISVDYEAEVQELETDSEIFDTNGMMFVGGVVLKSRLDAVDSDIHSITHSSSGGSFQGCIRDIEVNNQQLTLADTRVTHGVSMGCVYEFPCSDKPCKEEEVCTDIGIDGYECHCESQTCNEEFLTTVNPLVNSQSTKAVTTVSPVDVINEPISTKPVTLLEGGRVTITSNNIHLNVDLTTYDLRPSQILFRQQKPPKHGGVYRYVLRNDDETEQFTFLDLSGSSKITYQHDGSEHFKDKIRLVLEVLGKNSLPEQFENAEFTVDVNIIPVNDPPKLAIPSASILKIIRKSSIVLSSSELEAMDPDTDPNNLTYSVLDSRKIGYITVDDLRTKEFTQADVNAGRVLFVHTGPTNKSRVTLRVNDGYKYSRPVPLRIEAVPLEFSVIHHSKLRVNPGNSVVITTENLNIKSNANDQELDISYEILADPRYGEVQKTTNGKLWKRVNSFQQRHINKQKLRYVLDNYNSEAGRRRDAFSVRATCLGKTSEDVRVLVDILITEIRILNNTELVLNRQRRGSITSDHLSADVIDALFPSPVGYNILRPPVKGDILKNGEKLLRGQNFTQNDVNDGIVEYKINDEVGKTINDSFLFQAFVANTQSPHLKFDLAFVSEAGPVHLTNTGIIVREGGMFDISARELYVRVEENEDFEFIMTSTLQHGSLQLIDPKTSEIITSNITSFFNSDLKDGAIRYQHDDSEGFSDSFGFLASTSFVDQAGIMHEVQQPGYFNVNVNLVNDHKPKRVIQKPFRVIRNGKKLLTNRDLKFVDDDIDFDDADIEYRRQGIRNGQFVWVDDVETPVFRFLQRDIDEEKLLFKHSGVDEARMLLIVKDQDQSRLTTSYLAVIASDPFLTVVKTDSELPVKLGHTVTITSAYIPLETNLNIKDKNIVVDIVKPPVFGRILRLGSPVTSFTFEDLYLEKIEYESALQKNSQENLGDSFDFVVVSKELVTDGSLAVSIYLDSHQVVPEVFNNKPFFVEQGKAVILSKSNLRVYHENSLPGDIVFMVHQLPKYGVLRLNSNRNRRERRDAELTFTQNDVNQGRVEYLQTKDAGEGQDTFTYDVNNGQSMLYNLTFIIEIAPEMVPLNTENITVKEGGSKALTEDFINISHPYYEEDDYTIQLITNPSHGILDHSRSAGAISRFTKEDIQDEFVYYVHDGSDTLLDNFSFIANFTRIGKISDAYTMFVNVVAVDDHQPNVLVNGGLEVIIDSTSTLSGDILRTVDEDSGPDQIVYTLTPANNGHLVMKGALDQSILTFTQKDLDDGNIMFVHAGARTGGFRFQVSDGTHTSNRQIFSITAKALRISLTSNQPFIASMLSLEPITTDNLLVEANHDLTNRLVTYIVTRNPKHGQIVKTTSDSGSSGSSLLPVNQFLQDDVKKGIIGYLHTDVTDPATMDSFEFNVLVPFSQNLTNQQFNITIRPLDANGSLKVQNRGLNVTEGGEAVIEVANLNTENIIAVPSFAGEDETLQILYVATELPNHGAIKLNNIAVNLNGTFTNQDIEENQLTYLHDDSDTEKDFLTLMISLVDKQDSVVFHQTELFNISISPVNDETFEVVTKQLLMEVPQGAEYVVTKNDLQTIDPDTPPDHIVYQLLTKPNNGYLVLTINKSLSIMSFTQEDINTRRLIFIHDGGTAPGAFPFEVSDGAHKPLFKLLNIRIIATTVDITPGKEIQLIQGMTEVVVTRSNLNATTNGNRLHLAYNITTAPNFGNFVLEDELVTEFLQDDVDMHLVKYVQTDLSVSGDSFSYVATVGDDGTMSEEYSLNITVLPAFAINGFSATAASVFRLSSDQINATLLQNTQTDLVFAVAEQPAFGAMVNASSLKELTQFTYGDLLEGWIAIEVDHVDLQDNETLTDEYGVVASSAKVQPVLLHGVLRILPPIVPPTTEAPETTSHDIGSGAVAEPDFIADFNNSFDQDIASEIAGTLETLTSSPVYVEEKRDNSPPDSSIIPIIIPIVVVIIILIVIMLLVVWMIRKKRREDKSGRESPYPDMDGGPYPGASATPGRAGILPPINICAVNYSAALQEFPYNGSGSLHRPVASPLVPQVTVTPLGRPPSPSTIKKSSMVSINSNGTGSLSYSLSHDSHHGMPAPKLKKSQYWV